MIKQYANRDYIKRQKAAAKQNVLGVTCNSLKALRELTLNVQVPQVKPKFTTIGLH